MRLGNALAPVDHFDQRLLPRKGNRDGDRIVLAVAHGVVEQIGQQQPDAQFVDDNLPVGLWRLHFETAGVFDILRGDRAHESAKAHGFGHQRGVFLIEALGLDQIGDHQVDFIDVPAQLRGVFALLDKLQPQFRPRQRRAQLVADREQQRPLGFEHRLQRVGHVVDALGEFAELVLAVAVDAEAKIAVADALGALLEQPHRGQQPVHHDVVQQQREGGESEAGIERQRGDAGAGNRPLIEVELVAAALHHDDVFAADAADFGVGAEAVVEFGLGDVDAVVGVGTPAHDRAADLYRPAQLFREPHRVGQIGRRADAFDIDDRIDVAGEKVGNRVDGVAAVARKAQRAGDDEEEQQQGGAEDQQQPQKQRAADRQYQIGHNCLPTKV